MVLSVGEIAWFQQLGTAVSSVREKVWGGGSDVAPRCQGIHPTCADGSPPRFWDAPQDLREWRTFELADAMEQGLSRELTTHFVEPVRIGDEQRFLVRRSENRREYLLTTEQGDPLLLAQASVDGGKFDLFVAGSNDPPIALGPAFDLQANATRDEWTLRSMRCEQCEYRATRASMPRELARVSHYREEIGSSKAWCMDVTIPEVRKDGSCASWCPVCCGTGAADTGNKSTDLVMRRPTWNSRAKALTLDFFGRCSQASAKNIQLKVSGEAVGKDVSKVACLFGKTDTNTFTLDVRRPLGTVQAFAVALTTAHWC